jgi:hypothetical protein
LKKQFKYFFTSFESQLSNKIRFELSKIGGKGVQRELSSLNQLIEQSLSHQLTPIIIAFNFNLILHWRVSEIADSQPLINLRH